MENYWQSLKVSSTSTSKYKSGYFRPPSKTSSNYGNWPGVEGKKHVDLAAENAGKRKVVWGVPEDMEDDDVEAQEYMAEHMEDTMAISTDDSPPVVIVENPAGSELEQASEGIELGSTALKTDLWSNDIDAGATINPHLEADEGRISCEPPAVAPELPDIGASDVAPRSSTSQSDIREEIFNEAATEERGASSIAGSSTVATALTPNVILEAPPVISNQGSQTSNGIAESEDRAPEEGMEKDNVATP